MTPEMRKMVANRLPMDNFNQAVSLSNDFTVVYLTKNSQFMITKNESIDKK